MRAHHIRWSETDSQELNRVVKKYGPKWNKHALRFEGRTPGACQRHWYFEQSKSHKPTFYGSKPKANVWTKAELETLRSLRAKGWSFTLISERGFESNRSTNACAQKYHSLKFSSSRRTSHQPRPSFRTLSEEQEEEIVAPKEEIEDSEAEAGGPPRQQQSDERRNSPIVQPDILELDDEDSAEEEEQVSSRSSVKRKQKAHPFVIQPPPAQAMTSAADLRKLQKKVHQKVALKDALEAVRKNPKSSLALNRAILALEAEEEEEVQATMHCLAEELA